LTEPSAFPCAIALEPEPEIPAHLPALVVEQVALPLQEEQLCDGRLPARSSDKPPAQLGELLARAYLERVRLLHQPHRPAPRRAIQLVQEMLLRGEVPVDGAFRDPGFLGDERRRRKVVARGGEQLQRGAHQPLVGEIGLGHRARI